VKERRIKKESFRRGREAFFDYSVASIFGAEAAEVSGPLFEKNQDHGRLVWSHAPGRGGLPRRANLTRDYFFLVVFFLAFLAAFFFINVITSSHQAQPEAESAKQMYAPKNFASTFFSILIE
jgi:hypothetical protein